MNIAIGSCAVVAGVKPWTHALLCLVVCCMNIEAWVSRVRLLTVLSVRLFRNLELNTYRFFATRNCYCKYVI